MLTAKDIRVAPISAKDANALVKRVHYSGKVVQNSQLHLGVFLGDRLEGAMQFGPSLDKRKIQGLVQGTGWNNFIELNRMAFSDALPRNSESRALGVAFRMIKKHYPHIEWVISFSDGTQCGDGTIYRASGFVLTGIRENSTLYEFPTGDRIAGMTIEANWTLPIIKKQCDFLKIPHKYRTRKDWEKLGASALPGFQMRYIYFLKPEARARLTVPVLPFSKISDMGASMYKGEKITRVKKLDSEYPSEQGGAVPTDTLHLSPSEA
jgi:hypothetical protein